jgi:hypothetical protein
MRSRPPSPEFEPDRSRDYWFPAGTRFRHATRILQIAPGHLLCADSAHDIRVALHAQLGVPRRLPGTPMQQSSSRAARDRVAGIGQIESGVGCRNAGDCFRRSPVAKRTGAKATSGSPAPLPPSAAREGAAIGFAYAAPQFCPP